MAGCVALISFVTEVMSVCEFLLAGALGGMPPEFAVSAAAISALFGGARTARSDAPKEPDPLETALLSTLDPAPQPTLPNGPARPMEPNLPMVPDLPVGDLPKRQVSAGGPPPLPPPAPVVAPAPPAEPPVRQPDIPTDDPSAAADAGGLEQAMRDLGHVERLRAQLERGGKDLWRFHGPVTAPALQDALHGPGCPIIAFVNTKGGVGKTTLVANVAAHFASHGKRVLAVDLDDQAALSGMFARAMGASRMPASLVDPVLDGSASAEWIARSAISLEPIALRNLRFLSAGPSLRDVEARLFVSWLLDSNGRDVRTHLGTALTDRALRQSFDVILLDTPGRRDAATISALTASTHVVVPTILDGLSISNAGRVLSEITSWAQVDLNPGLKIAGVVGTKTTAQLLSNSEVAAQKSLMQIAEDATGKPSLVFSVSVPHRTAFAKAAGQNLAYQADLGRNSVQDIIDTFSAELANRVG
ncbi:MAG: ParA family protein [Pseudomonadota bacterium]